MDNYLARKRFDELEVEVSDKDIIFRYGNEELIYRPREDPPTALTDIERRLVLEECPDEIIEIAVKWAQNYWNDYEERRLRKKYH